MAYHIEMGFSQNGAITIAELFADLAAGTITDQYKFASVSSSNGNNVKLLGPNQGEVLNLQFNGGLRCGPLITCAAFIVWNGPAVYALHANAGTIDEAEIEAALTQLDTTANAVYVVYSHPGPPGGGYAESIVEMIQSGINTDRIVEIYGNGASFAVNGNWSIGL